MIVGKQFKQKPSKNIINHFQKESRSFQWTYKFNEAKSTIIPSTQSSPAHMNENIKSLQVNQLQKQIKQEDYPKVSMFCQQGIKNFELDKKCSTNNAKASKNYSKAFQSNNDIILTPYAKKSTEISSVQKQWYKKIMFPSKEQKDIQKKIQQMLIQQSQKIKSKGKHYYTISTQYSNNQKSRHFLDQTIKSVSSISKNSTLRKYLCEQSLNKHRTQQIKNKENRSHNNSNKSSQKNSQKKISCFNPYQSKENQNQSNNKKIQSQKKQNNLLNQLLEIAKGLQQIQSSLLINQGCQNPQKLILGVKNKINKIVKKVLNEKSMKQGDN